MNEPDPYHRLLKLAREAQASVDRLVSLSIPYREQKGERVRTFPGGPLGKIVCVSRGRLVIEVDAKKLEKALLKLPSQFDR